jgi:hypothetical protein
MYTDPDYSEFLDPGTEVKMTPREKRSIITVKNIHIMINFVPQ